MIHPRASILPRLVIWAALAAACGGGDGSEDAGSSGAESTGSGASCQDDDECEAGACHPQEHVCVEDTCDPKTEEIGPEPHDHVGDACCTNKPGCTGYDRMGEPINELYIGDTLKCVGEQWVADPDYCDTCPEGTVPLGCVWDSDRGDFVRPLCVCQ